MMKKNVQDLSNFAAKVLAKAVLDCFPSSKLIFAGKSDIGFFVDLFFPDPVHDQMLSFFEEKMRGILSVEKKVKVFEMMPDNAIEYLISLKNHDDRAFEEVNFSSLQKMIKIDSFIDFFEFTEEKNWIDLLKFFHLFSFEKKENVLRIEGLAFFEKAMLKEKLKKIKSYKKTCHENVGVKEEYFLFDEDKNIILLSKGLQAKNTLESLYKASLREDVLFVQTPYAEDTIKKNSYHIDLASKYYKKKCPLKFAEKCLVLEKGEEHRSLFRYPMKEHFLETSITEMDLLESECISHLQFIEKILKICGFSFDVVIQYPKKDDEIDRIMLSALQKSDLKFEVETRKEKHQLVVFTVEDIKGRLHKVMHLSAKSVLLANPKMGYYEKLKAAVVSFSFFEMHQLLALLLEWKGEKINVFMREIESLLNNRKISFEN